MRNIILCTSPNPELARITADAVMHTLLRTYTLERIEHSLQRPLSTLFEQMRTFPRNNTHVGVVTLTDTFERGKEPFYFGLLKKLDLEEIQLGEPLSRICMCIHPYNSQHNAESGAIVRPDDGLFQVHPEIGISFSAILSESEIPVLNIDSLTGEQLEIEKRLETEINIIRLVENELNGRSNGIERL